MNKEKAGLENDPAFFLLSFGLTGSDNSFKVVLPDFSGDSSF